MFQFFTIVWAIMADKEWYRVVYPDGRHSVRMEYLDARAYMKKFGGKVIEDRP